MAGYSEALEQIRTEVAAAINAAVAAEREACAKVVEAFEKKYDFDDAHWAYMDAIEEMAAAIRARSNPTS